MKLNLKFNFNQLERGELRFNGSASSSYFALSDDDLVKFGELSYDIAVARISGGAIMSGNISVLTTMHCVRCLKTFDHVIVLKDINHFYEMNAEREFDLIPDLREDILVALPLKMICEEDCKGLCQICGADLNSGACACKNGVLVSDDCPWNRLDQLKIKTKSRGVSHGSAKTKKV
jgi:uncharacterized metal-binding protein YceD (DUF177 family)